MATVRWLGTKPVRQQVETITVSNATAGTIYTITHQNGAVVTAVAVTGDTVDTAASRVAEAMVAYGDVFSELDVQATGAGGIITVTGPDDGMPFTLTATSSPGARISNATATTPLGPHDLAEILNYSTGALPAGGDTLVFENTSKGPKTGLTALAGIGLAKTVRRLTFTGQIGLTDISPNGYAEFRTKELNLDSDIMELDAAASDTPGQFRLKFVSVAATAITINGGNSPAPAIGSEPFIIEGCVSTSSLAIVGSGVWICPSVASTCVLPTLTAYGSSVRVGDTATLTTVKLTLTNADISSAMTTCTLDRGGQVRIGGSGAITTFNIEAGTVFYQSTGTITALNIGSDGTFDATLAAGAFTVTTMTCRGDGCTVNDPTRRINLGTNIVLTGTDLSRTKFDFGTGGTFAFSA